MFSVQKPLVLECNNLKKYFPIHSGIFRRKTGEVKAVDDVSFSIREGEIVGLVGESGSGKSTAGMSSIRLIEPTSASLSLLGTNIMELKRKQLRNFRIRAQVVFQDPYASLDPRKHVLDNVGDAIFYHGIVKTEEEKKECVMEVLKQVKLGKESLYKHPHEFSGGQLQRISIARSLALKPKLIILDEAVSALDLSVQAQILNLLLELKMSLNLSYLFISHDLGIVRDFCDRVLVMYRGKIVESGATEEVFMNPQHAYTKQLISCVPGN